MLKNRCCPWFDKLTMRAKPLKTPDLILSPSKDEAKISSFFSILLGPLAPYAVNGAGAPGDPAERDARHGDPRNTTRSAAVWTCALSR
jgi:hypothetical protein